MGQGRPSMRVVIPKFIRRKGSILGLALLGGVVLSGCSTFSGGRLGGVEPKSANNALSNSSGDVRRVGYDEEVAEEDAGFQMSDLTPSAIAENAKGTFARLSGKPSNEDLAQGLKEEAEGEYLAATKATGAERTQLFRAAAKKFASAAARKPESSLEEEALFLSGESFFFGDHYWKANEQFEKLIAAYPNTRYLDTAETRRLAIAHYWLEVHRADPQSIFTFNLIDEERPTRDTFGHSLRVFDKIRLEDPTGRLADDATLAAANAHFLAGDYLKADSFYTDLRRAFPSSEHQFVAHFMGAKAKLLSYRGADYGGDLLEEAEKLFKTMRTQFPMESEKRRKEIEKAHAEVRREKAERVWRTSQFYYNRQEYGAARFSYQEIIDDYPGTPHAQRAQQRLDEIAAKPDVPPQRLKWLVDLFPSEQDEIPAIANQPLADHQH